MPETAPQSVEVYVVNAFVKDGKGGNPAGVVADADHLDEKAMQAVAAKVGLSETAFVSRSRTEGFKLDFFTPTRRIAHCGHATIGAFSYLAAAGRVGEGETSKETVDGPRKILIRDGEAFMEQLAPTYLDADNWGRLGVSVADVLASLGLSASDIAGSFTPTRIDTGNRFVVLGVGTGAILASLEVDLQAIERISEKLDLIGYYVFTTDDAATDFDATARMFAPRYGIVEEAATGMAAGPLACLLHDRGGSPKPRYFIEQGSFMPAPSPSLIRVDLKLDQQARITGLMAGGRGVKMRAITVRI